MLADIAAGWSMVLSNLKTLLETGRPLQNALEATSQSKG
jgi:type II secretory pathway component PulF